MKVFKQFLFSTWLKTTLLICVVTILSACAGGSGWGGHRAFHTFAFDPSRESANIEVLYYRYGSANEHGLRTSNAEVAQGKSSQSINITGDLPVGEDFYVKWRDKGTGKVHEDIVDLRLRLSFSMHKQELHPIIEGGQLYVYLISYEPQRPYFTHAEADAIDAYAKTKRQKVLANVARQKIVQIYPDRIEDPQLPHQPKK